MGSQRPSIPKEIELQVISGCRRRCCVCLALSQDTEVKEGQIAHLDGNASNNSLRNLAFLCLEHHVRYDMHSNQSRNQSIREIRKYQAELTEWLAVGPKDRAGDSSLNPVRDFEELNFEVSDSRSCSIKAARRFYWNARKVLEEQRTDVGFSMAKIFLEKAIKIDPNFAEAYAALSKCYVLMPEYCVVNIKKVMKCAMGAADRAIEIVSTLAEAYACRGIILDQYLWLSKQSERAFKEAIRLDENLIDARRWFSVFLYHRARFDEALKVIEIGRKQAPESAILNETAGAIRVYRGEYRLAEKELCKAISIDPIRPMTHNMLGRLHLIRGDFDKAIKKFKHAKECATRPGYGSGSLGHAYAVFGRRREARRELSELQGLGPLANVETYKALIHHGLGENEKAFCCLNEAVAGREPELGLLKIDTRWERLRSDRRFAGILKKIGLN